MALSECQRQMHGRKWNCSTLNNSSQNSHKHKKSKRTAKHREQTTIFGDNLVSGTREAAFVYALSSAAVVHSVTKNCRKGRLTEDCGCDQTWPIADTMVKVAPSAGFEWGGCSDNVAWGKQLSKAFVDAEEYSNTKRRVARVRCNKKVKRAENERRVNLKNNEVGRQVRRL